MRRENGSGTCDRHESRDRWGHPRDSVPAVGCGCHTNQYFSSGWGLQRWWSWGHGDGLIKTEVPTWDTSSYASTLEQVQEEHKYTFSLSGKKVSMCHANVLGFVTPCELSKANDNKAAISKQYVTVLNRRLVKGSGHQGVVGMRGKFNTPQPRDPCRRMGYFTVNFTLPNWLWQVATQAGITLTEVATETDLQWWPWQDLSQAERCSDTYKKEPGGYHNCVHAH